MAVTNLTGYTWKANDTLMLLATTETYNLNFKSNNTEYTAFKTVNVFDDIIYDEIYYNDTLVYDDMSNVWQNDAFKTIDITGGSDATNLFLISILENNGTLTPTASSSKIKIGDLSVDNFKIGDNQVSKICLGDTLVWQSK